MLAPHGDRRHRRHRHAAPDPPDPRRPGRSPARSGRPRTSTPCARAAADRARHRRHRPRRHGHDGRAVHRRRGQRLAASHRRLRLRHQAHDPAPPQPARDGRGRAGDDAAPPTCSPANPTASSSPTAPATRPASPAPPTIIAELLGTGPGVRDLPRPSAARHGARRRHGQAAVRPPRRQPPGAGPRRRGRSRSPARTTTSPSPPTASPGVATMTHVNLNDGVCEGLGGGDANAFSRAAPSRGRARPARQRLPVRPVRRRGMAGTVVADAPARRPRSILVIGSGPIVIGQACEFDYSGTQACRVLREEGYRVDPRQLEPGDDHDRPRLRRSHVHRAADAGGAGRDHRARAARRRAADARRPDRRSTSRWSCIGAALIGVPGHAGDDRRRRRGDRHRRGPRASSRRRWSRSASTCPASGIAHTLDEALDVVGDDRAAGDHPPRLHPRRARHGHRRDRRGVRAGSPPPGWRPARSARSSSRSRSPAGRSSSSR